MSLMLELNWSRRTGSAVTLRREHGALSALDEGEVPELAKNQVRY